MTDEHTANPPHTASRLTPLPGALLPPSAWRCVLPGCVATFPTFSHLARHEYQVHHRPPLGMTSVCRACDSWWLSVADRDAHVREQHGEGTP